MSRRTIVITGATRGLGRALVTRFVEAGHAVYGCGRSPAAVAALQRELGGAHGFESVDVRDERQVRVWVQGLLAHGGPPQLLINNAALINRTAPLWRLGADELDDVIDVNVKGTANVIRHILPAMIAAGRGVVVNVSSYWGRSCAAGEAPYCASKWAIEGLTGSLAQELPRGLAAVAVNPGVIDTQMLRTCFGPSAAGGIAPEAWSEVAAPFLLGLGPQHNGASLTVPGQ